MKDISEHIVNGITLDPENKEFMYALECAQYTNQLIYLTGKAGTGKTTFLQYLRQVTQKKMVVLAPTGVAAINAKGQTIHSFFHIPISLFVPNDERLHEGFYDTFKYKDDTKRIIRSIELLVIDEVSMVRCDLLDVVDVILRRVRKCSLPFGGVQVILIGDTFQLPPVIGKNDGDIIYKFYDSEFFFSARVMSRVRPLYIELKKVYRQKEKEFVDVLNRIRIGKQVSSDIQLLNSRVRHGLSDDETKNYIVLTTTNDAAGEENSRRLAALPSDSFIFDANIVGDFPESNYPTDMQLELKVGAQVMFIKNNWQKDYFNGKIGIISKIKGSSIVVDVTNSYNEVHSIVVDPEKWENIVYTWNEKEKKVEETVTGTFTQYPLKLAWAITVHKSQGMTFEKVIADIGYSFASGQVYVALSRCTSLNGLILKSPISSSAIKTDPRVTEFAKKEVPETLLIEELQKGKADYYYAESRRCLRRGDAEGCYNNFITAIKYRNDIETNLFKRFVVVSIKRFYDYVVFRNTMHALINKIVLENDTLENTVNSKEEEIKELTGNVKELSSELSAQKDKVRNLESEIKSLKKELSRKDWTIIKRDKEITSQTELIQELRNKNEGLASDIISYEQKVETLHNTINNLLTINSNQEDELERVRNIKWYQKLFGKN